jgi:hypothetical protein
MKDKGERLREAVTLLKKLMQVGIPVTDPGYKQSKGILDAWITGDVSGNVYNDVKQEIHFMRYGRVGHLSLFCESGKNPVFVLKATEELKESLADSEA